MAYITERWNSPVTVQELIQHLQTLPKETKVFHDFRLLITVEEVKVKRELQIREREII